MRNIEILKIKRSWESKKGGSFLESKFINYRHGRVINEKKLLDVDSLLNCRLEAENRSMKLRMSE